MALTVIVAFAVLFLFGFPVVVAIAVPAIIYILVADIPLELVAQRMTYALDSFPLVAVPVFIFVGSLMNQSGITSDIYRFAHTLAGRVPGGLAQVNVIGSLIFSGVSGAAFADIGGLGRIEVRAMVRAGLHPRLCGRDHRRVGDRRADLPALDPDHHLRVRHHRLDRAAPGRRDHAGVALRRAADDHGRGPGPKRYGHPRSPRWPTFGEIWRTLRAGRARFVRAGPARRRHAAAACSRRRRPPR